MIDNKFYLELNQNEGSKEYEVIKIIPSENETSFFFLDSISKLLYVNSYFEDNEDDKKDKYERLKVNIFGDILDTGETEFALKDGTMWDWKYYRNWLINGDTTKIAYIDPVTKKEKTNSNKWLLKFEEFYEKASYVYIYISSYYLKINEEWYKISDDHQVMTSAFEKQYPAKEDQDVRMIELEDLSPAFYERPEKRDTTLLREVKYESKFFDKSDRGSAFNFSAGWWYLDLYMGEDTLHIKRFASYRRPELKLYKIPKAYGGKDDVLFIIQTPDTADMFPEQTGGMYVIRPRNYKDDPYFDKAK